MAGHNLWTVTSFEFMRTVKKKTFWIGTLGVPVIIGIVMALLVLTQTEATRTADSQKHATVDFAFTDSSGLITDDLAASYGGTRTEDPVQALQDVREGRSQAYFAIPGDPAREEIEIHGKDLGVFESGTYGAVAGQMVSDAATAKIGSPELAALAGGGTTFTSTLYADGDETGGIYAVVPPLVFLAFFYAVMMFMGNQILNSTVEEKENRVTEMIRTTLAPKTLISGKILALMLTGLVQIGVIGIPAAGLFLTGGGGGGGGGAASEILARMDPQPGTMVTGAVLLAGSLLLFTATLMAIGAVVPTAKDANGLFSAITIVLFVPLYAFSLFVSDPDAVLVQVFLYFPFSAPVAAMLLNGLGFLTGTQAAVVAAELFIAGGIMMALAVKLFSHGNIRYHSRIPLKELMRSR
ncbi:ABC transporter permease [Arthrobacter caoxuetaonis]|uniref:ABC transporter permease n=1 Tax=Arthrobacter caoxuetaonis TaxID=2886935 RepID=A0A9X1MHL1_9MICC|nr:ABC transporter permease [Arthrobacter caoxuetaonis]MCC3299761.1 ABC transporter permease [Arthrobacter caoxuetaonis]USQ59338.1 ABC transporter permease [Arthrobacter caoxuetaonis]